ncbi:hypothetical protein C5B42_02280 [Candidatus Cerribacteria bacterium 'Amazon FNV 2010 28 9']|uniref:Squalene cyclase C-terminal domain-containing protein n=1 Tax=Candidatus Cerribacteria bacterium 'Amazon FNV 2010 28 9' TaxID=2081795 RepID=A0A317JRT5_9BACT|nr:MAG: hypothetical protein C5B42_02280 [Candidatus Cerribacteria bacterium 'Amazon FNV 2010 28 9']
MIEPNKPLDPNEIQQIIVDITDLVASWQNPHDGGWSIPQPPPDAYYTSNVWTTAQITHWLLHHNAERYQERIRRGLYFLAQTQRIEDNGYRNEASDGGWGWYKDRVSESTGTATAMLAFVEYAKRFQTSEPFTKNMRWGRDWLIYHGNPDGGFSLLANRPSAAFNTCWSCIALSECVLIPGLEDYLVNAAVLPIAVAFVESKATTTGWGYAIEQASDAIGTAYCTYLLLYMGRTATATIGLKALRNSQLDDGSWEPAPTLPNLEATTWATTALLKGKISPKAAWVESAMRYILDHYIPGLGWPERSNGRVQLWTTYFAYMTLAAYMEAIRSQSSL